MDTLTRKGEKSPFLLPPKSKNQIAKSTIKRKTERKKNEIPLSKGYLDKTKSTIKRISGRVPERISGKSKSTIKRISARISERIPVDIFQSNMI